MDRSAQLQRNIFLLRVLRGFSMVLFTIPVIVLYYTAHGLSMEDVMLLQSIFAITMVLIEVPSGYLSDVLGRRTTMISGTALAWMGWLYYAFASTFADFVVAEALLGIGIAFVSGTDSAMLFDTLLELGHTGRSLKEEGLQLSFGNFAEAVGAIVGGALAWYGLHTPFVVQGIWMAIPSALTLFLVEPSAHRRIGTSAGWTEIRLIAHRVLRADVGLRSLIIVSSILSASTLVIVWLLQPYWKLAGIPIGLFGVLWSAGNAMVGIVSIRAHSIAERYSTKSIFGALIGLVAASCIIAGLFPGLAGVAILFTMYLSRGLLNPVMNTEINNRVESSQRATMLSIRQLGMRLVFLFAAPFIGRVSDKGSVTESFVVVGAALAAIGGLALWLLVFDRTHHGGLVRADNGNVLS